MNKIHELKTDSDVFQALLRGNKTYEIRKDDRGFSVGDKLLLRETAFTGAEMACGMPLEYTGLTDTRKVTHILRGPRFGLEEGWVIMSVENPRIAQLEADCAAHKAAEETQIALRQKADEREAALAAHVERLRSALNYCSEYLYASHLNTIGHGSKAHMEMVSALEDTQHYRGEP